MSRIVLDAGAFVAFERNDVRLRARLAAVRRLELELVTTSPVLAQVWRNGRHQALLARLAGATRVEAPDEAAARRAGELLARTKTSDVVDALLVDVARDGDSVLTSDPEDLLNLIGASGKKVTVYSV